MIILARVGPSGEPLRRHVDHLERKWFLSKSQVLLGVRFLSVVGIRLVL